MHIKKYIYIFLNTHNLLQKFVLAIIWLHCKWQSFIFNVYKITFISEKVFKVPSYGKYFRMEFNGFGFK